MRRCCSWHRRWWARPAVVGRALLRRTRGVAACRCRWGTSRAVAGRPLVPRARGAPASGIVDGGQVVRSSVGRWLPRTRGAAACGIVDGEQVVRSSVVRGRGRCGPERTRTVLK